MLTPSIFLIHWECLSLLIFSSCRTAHSLFLASCLLPGPTWCSRPKRHPTCALIAETDKSRLICATIMASSWSDPPSGLPSDRTWNLSLALARISTRSWTSWLASPQAPKQSPIMSPNSSSLLSTGPLCPLFVPDIVWSRALALSVDLELSFQWPWL